MLLIFVPAEVDQELHPDFYKKVSTLSATLRPTLVQITGGEELNVMVQTWNGPYVLAFLVKKRNSFRVRDFEAVGDIMVAMNRHLHDTIDIEVICSDHTVSGDTFSGVVQVRNA